MNLNPATFNERENAIYELGHRDGEASQLADKVIADEVGTQLDRFTQLLNDFHIPFTSESNPPDAEQRIVITIKPGEAGSSVDGYSMFFTEFAFTTDGNFISMGIWE